MTLEQMFICCVRVNKLPIDDKVVLNYISVVNKELGQECRRDQFKFRISGSLGKGNGRF